MKDLGTLGGSVSIAMHINDLGQIVGRSATAEDGDGARGLRAFLWAGGSGMKDLGSLGGYARAPSASTAKGRSWATPSTPTVPLMPSSTNRSAGILPARCGRDGRARWNHARPQRGGRPCPGLDP